MRHPQTLGSELTAQPRGLPGTQQGPLALGGGPGATTASIHPDHSQPLPTASRPWGHASGRCWRGAQGLGVSGTLPTGATAGDPGQPLPQPLAKASVGHRLSSGAPAPPEMGIQEWGSPERRWSCHELRDTPRAGPNPWATDAYDQPPQRWLPYPQSRSGLPTNVEQSWHHLWKVPSGQGAPSLGPTGIQDQGTEQREPLLSLRLPGSGRVGDA